MYGLGAWALLPLGWWWPLFYLDYVLASNLMFIRTVCPGCLNFGRPSCGSGFGLLAARMARPGGGERFPSRFRICLPLLALAWVIPLAGGALALYLDLGKGALVLDIVPLVAFAIMGFGVLPFTSKKECHACAMRDRCPGARVTSEGRHEDR